MGGGSGWRSVAHRFNFYLPIRQRVLREDSEPHIATGGQRLESLIGSGAATSFWMSLCELVNRTVTVKHYISTISIPCLSKTTPEFLMTIGFFVNIIPPALVAVSIRQDFTKRFIWSFLEDLQLLLCIPFNYTRSCFFSELKPSYNYLYRWIWIVGEWKMGKLCGARRCPT